MFVALWRALWKCVLLLSVVFADDSRARSATALFGKNIQSHRNARKKSFVQRKISNHKLRENFWVAIRVFETNFSKSVLRFSASGEHLSGQVGVFHIFCVSIIAAYCPLFSFKWALFSSTRFPVHRETEFSCSLFDFQEFTYELDDGLRSGNNLFFNSSRSFSSVSFPQSHHYRHQSRRRRRRCLC